MNKMKLFISILSCQLIGILGSIFTMPAISSWYTTLTKPFFTPPSWLFAPVWTLLYLLMGISLYLVWTSKYTQKSILYFEIQLFLNFLWSVVFFGTRNIFNGFVVIVFLWFFILLTMIEFRKISKTSFRLLIPYLLWVTFASILNLSLLILN